MKVRHKDYFIYSHGSWRIFHAGGSCWPDFFSEFAIALIIPYILYNDNVMLRTVKIWLISEATNGEHVLASDQWYAYMNLPVTSVLSYPFCTVVIISMYRSTSIIDMEHNCQNNYTPNDVIYILHWWMELWKEKYLIPVNYSSFNRFT